MRELTVIELRDLTSENDIKPREIPNGAGLTGAFAGAVCIIGLAANNLVSINRMPMAAFLGALFEEMAFYNGTIISRHDN